MIVPLKKTKSVLALSGLFAFSWFLAGSVLPAPKQSPQAILVLGGAPSREKFAAKFALQHPNLPIWVSSGSPEEYATYVFGEAGIPRSRIHLDYRAVDTVTNFTTLVDDLKKQKITDIYVITADYHMPRAQIIGSVVLGSRGIRMYPVTVPSKGTPEGAVKLVRDGLRSVFWLATGSPLSR
jgi:uncharacterized SAM-binding protein YcdF (DUF218 family)